MSRPLGRLQMECQEGPRPIGVRLRQKALTPNSQPTCPPIPYDSCPILTHLHSVRNHIPGDLLDRTLPSVGGQSAGRRSTCGTSTREPAGFSTLAYIPRHRPIANLTRPPSETKRPGRHARWLALEWTLTRSRRP